MPGITIALAGARNSEQAVANAKAGDVKISQDEMEFINSHLSALNLVKN